MLLRTGGGREEIAPSAVRHPGGENGSSKDNNIEVQAIAGGTNYRAAVSCTRSESLSIVGRWLLVLFYLFASFFMFPWNTFAFGWCCCFNTRVKSRQAHKYTRVFFRLTR